MSAELAERHRNVYEVTNILIAKGYTGYAFDNSKVEREGHTIIRGCTFESTSASYRRNSRLPRRKPSGFPRRSEVLS